MRWAAGIDEDPHPRMIGNVRLQFPYTLQIAGGLQIAKELVDLDVYRRVHIVPIACVIGNFATRGDGNFATRGDGNSASHA